MAANLHYFAVGDFVNRWVWVIAGTLSLSATAEHASSRGATDYKRSEGPQQIAKLGQQAVETLSSAGTASAKAIADSSAKAQANFSQIISQTQEAGQDTLSKLAGTIPDPNSLTSESSNFDELAKAKAALNQTTIQMLQVQSQAFAQLPQPTATPAPKVVTNLERMQVAAKMRPTKDSGFGPAKIYRPLENSSLPKGGLTRLPAAYNAPRGL